MNKNWLTYQELELIPDSMLEPERPPASLGEWFSHLWKAIQHSFFEEEVPVVYRTVDPSGLAWWKLYDPKTNQSIVLMSDDSFQSWIKRHH